MARRLVGDENHFWQRRYYDLNVRNEAQFVEKLHYVHSNQVNAGLCGRHEDWPWSSFLHQGRFEWAIRRKHISTSYIERQNLTLRMMSRRVTRLTNGFNKSLKHLRAAIALHFADYNFCWVHKTLKTTPSVAAGIRDHTWTLEELLA